MSATATQERLAGTWAYAPVHSSVAFKVKYLVASFSSTFKDVEARLEGGKLYGKARVDSIDIADENLRAHLGSPEFFDTDNHPELSFESEELQIDGDQVRFDGSLTIKGTTLPIQANGTINGPVEDFLGNTRLGITVSTKIDRTAYGVDWNADLPKGGRALSDEVEITAELEFHRTGE